MPLFIRPYIKYKVVHWEVREAAAQHGMQGRYDTPWRCDEGSSPFSFCTSCAITSLSSSRQFLPTLAVISANPLALCAWPCCDRRLPWDLLSLLLMAGAGCACPPGTVAKTRGCFTPCAHALVGVKRRTIHCLFLDLHAAPCTYITAAGCLQLFPWCAFILAVTFYSLSLKHEVHTSKGEPTPLCGVVSINGI